MSILCLEIGAIAFPSLTLRIVLNTMRASLYMVK
jgi:hypothetical protein